MFFHHKRHPENMDTAAEENDVVHRERAP